jgi:hypothetical protein
VSKHVYYTDDCTMQVPVGFGDLTTHALQWTTPEDDAIALTIHRQQIPLQPEGGPPFDLHRWVIEQTQDYPRSFLGFRMEREEVASGDARLPMRRLAFRWNHEGDVVYHHQVFVLAHDRIIMLIGSAKARHREAIDALVDGAVADFRIREG